MDLRLDVRNKCRICLTPDTNENFIQLNGSKAEMFTEVIGVELTIDGVKSEAVMCQNCFSELKNFHDFKARGNRAHRDHFKIQRQLATAQHETNDTEQESEAGTTANESHSPVRVKHEPPVEFVSILPRATNDQSEDEDPQIHQRQVHDEKVESNSDCDTCDKSFSTPKYLQAHQRNVHNEKVAKCKVCEKICKNVVLLRYHIQIHVMVECSVCSKMISKNKLAHHVRSHAGHFECDFCKYFTNTKNSLKVHIERQHLLKKLVKDSKYRQDFSDFELLEKLQLKYPSSATSAEKKFQCDKCEKLFGTPKSLYDHKRQVHPGKLFNCQVCKKAFKTKSNLKRHNARAHA